MWKFVIDSRFEFALLPLKDPPWNPENHPFDMEFICPTSILRLYELNLCSEGCILLSFVDLVRADRHEILVPFPRAAITSRFPRMPM